MIFADGSQARAHAPPGSRRSRRPFGRRPQASRSLKVRPHDVNELSGGLIAVSWRRTVEHVRDEMLFEYFGHQAIHRAARTRDQLQRRAAVIFVFKRAFDRRTLSLDATDPRQEFRFLSDAMSMKTRSHPVESALLHLHTSRVKVR